MTQFIKHKIILSCLFFGGFLNASQVQEVKVPEPVKAPVATHYDLEAFAKVKDIRKTSSDVLKIYREMGATGQQVAVPYIFLSFLGHPNYFAVAQDHNVCVFMYCSPTEGKRKYIFLAKLVEGAVIKKVVENLGGSIEEYEGWTFFAKHKEDFGLIKDRKWMVSYANGRSKGDIEFSFQPSIVSLTKLSLDKELNITLKNLNETVGSINVNDTQILIDGVLNYKGYGPEFGNWLAKNATQAGLSIQIIPKGKKESEMHMVLERKNLGSLIDQLRAKVLALEVK